MSYNAWTRKCQLLVKYIVLLVHNCRFIIAHFYRKRNDDTRMFLSWSKLSPQRSLYPMIVGSLQEWHRILNSSRLDYIISSSSSRIRQIRPVVTSPRKERTISLTRMGEFSPIRVPLSTSRVALSTIKLQQNRCYINSMLKNLNEIHLPMCRPIMYVYYFSPTNCHKLTSPFLLELGKKASTLILKLTYLSTCDHKSISLTDILSC